MEEADEFALLAPVDAGEQLYTRNLRQLPVLGSVVYLGADGQPRNPTELEALTEKVFGRHAAILRRYYEISQNPNYEELYPIDLGELHMIKRYFSTRENGDRVLRQIEFSNSLVDYAFGVTNDRIVSSSAGVLQRLQFEVRGNDYEYVDKGFEARAERSLRKNLGQLALAHRSRRA
jgi:hypothetical protein